MLTYNIYTFYIPFFSIFYYPFNLSFIIEYIMGQKTEADWESFKQSWNDMGGADWTKEVNEQYKSIAG